MGAHSGLWEISLRGFCEEKDVDLESAVELWAMLVRLGDLGEACCVSSMFPPAPNVLLQLDASFELLSIKMGPASRLRVRGWD